DQAGGDGEAEAGDATGHDGADRISLHGGPGSAETVDFTAQPPPARTWRTNSCGRRPGANRKPWPTGTPRSTRKRRWASCSTPSATRPSPRLLAMPDTAWQTATSDVLPGTPETNSWLSFRPWIGSRRR